MFSGLGNWLDDPAPVAERDLAVDLLVDRQHLVDRGPTRALTRYAQAGLRRPSEKVLKHLVRRQLAARPRMAAGAQVRLAHQ